MLCVHAMIALDHKGRYYNYCMHWLDSVHTPHRYGGVVS